MKKIALLASLFLILLLCSSCVKLQPPITTFKEYQVKKINLISADLDFIFNIENPNDIPLNIKSVDYTLYIEGNELISGKSEGFDLLAKDKKQIKIPINISYLGTLGTTAELVKTLIVGDRRLNYGLKGTLEIESLGASVKVPINAKGELVLIK